MFHKPWFRYSLCGIAAGIVNGLFGAGGGMVLVPLLIGYANLEDKKAFSSCIAIILPICIISLIAYYSQNIFPVTEAFPYLIGGLVGGLVGGKLFRQISPVFLHKIFGIIILWGGFRLLWT